MVNTKLICKYQSNMASKPIDIRWIITDSKAYWKNMYRILLKTAFRGCKKNNHDSNTSFVTQAFGPFSLTKLELILYFFQLTNRGTLSLIRCDR